MLTVLKTPDRFAVATGLCMSRSRGWIWWLVLACVLTTGDSHRCLRGAEPETNPAKARQTFLREMRKKSPQARIDAIQTLADFPAADIVDPLVKKGLSDLDPEVRVAARQVIQELGQDPATAEYLHGEFKRYSKKQNSDGMLSGLLGGMIATTDESQRAAYLKTLDDYLASPKGHLIVPVSVIDDLAEQGGADAVQYVATLSKVAPFKSQFGYRRCIVQAMRRIREPQVVGFLIEMLPGSTGLVQAEIIDYLTFATRQNFKDNDREWTKWWNDSKETFELPSSRIAAEAIPDNQPAYYGIPICAKRVVFVLDTSISMRGAPIEQAKQALIATIESLPEEVDFNIVMFDKGTALWQPRMMPATLASKQGAIQTVITRGMAAGTASHAALNAAFGLDPEVIYFLSDGDPTDGQPGVIVESMSERNRTRRITIHTIGVVTQTGGAGGLTFFMKPLAEHNFGRFQLVE